jgi:very-short-patch-repair endonuclease
MNQTMRDFSKYKNIPRYITILSRKNRLEPTIQEKMLWEELSGKKLLGLRFRRQFPVGRYIVDFYNHQHKLVIEIDGEIHKEQKEYDENRDRYLEGCGLHVIRFTNTEIESDLPGVINSIIKFTTKVPLRGI